MTDNKESPKRPSSADGANVGWAAVGYLISGIGVWGFLGWIVDRWLDVPKHFGMMIGMLVGMAGAIYLVVKKLGA
ncbi:hypothetical protein Lfu02_52850 [Longispora fulva]|uniref:F0F1-type ATP synthase assembly protein I n=1 Tax=Longispora fulva TaxID=619741 RepID=A0A8J7GHL0_9ACTN|nr:AtpZ/AtpI family protein [Longispora fulva]MBG6140823.1 F0F1-type ATP synthase assembly protein I [Longispora fulva]GIG60913.1 hypothetical protein Lfu02_52850 [Longispora fulva]